MNFTQTIHNAWDRNQLMTALIELTYACNLRCVFCYNDLALKGAPLSLQQYYDLFEDLASLNALNLTLSGGEPLAHPDFFQLGTRARDLGFVVRIKSNGHAIKPHVAQRLRNEIDPYVIEVSLHGATASTHDKQTQVSGSFERLTANIAGMKSIGLRVKANSVLTKWNEAEIPQMYQLCATLGVPLQIDTDVKPRDDGDRSPLELQPTQQGREQYLAAASQQKRVVDFDAEPTPVPERKKHCGAGSSTVAIDPYGNVLPCVQWRQPIGNLHQTRMRDLWTASSSLQEIRQTTQDARGFIAQHGGDAVLGNFCPGIAHTHSGNPLSLYPALQTRMIKVRDQRRELPIVYEVSS